METTTPGRSRLAEPKALLKRLFVPFYLLLLSLCLGGATIFVGYDEPSEFFWDENYHIASAQKYLNQVFFQEPHPPLGKLLIAAGEWLFEANSPELNSLYLDTNHAKDPPEQFSFQGYRFFPALLGALCVPVFGLLVWRLTGSHLLSVLAACCFAFDNALVVHLRGAMLEGPQLFLLLAAALATAHRSVAFAGLCCGLALATKINSLPTALLLGLIALYPERTNLASILRTTVQFAGYGIVAWACVWQIHFALGQQVRSDTYKASQEYLAVIRAGEGGKLSHFSTALHEAQIFFADYQRGVPTLNLCKSEENGSYPLLWPLGSQSINYRWERKDGRTAYLYLQANPAIWLFSLLGVVGGIVYLVRRVGRTALNRTDLLIGSLVALYAAGIFAPLLLDRVFYLYHFFIPLLTGNLIALLCIARLGEWLSRRIVAGAVAGTIALIGGCFLYFAPLTYAQPLTDQQLQARAWLTLWNLRCAGCESIFPLARPLSENRRPKETIFISGIQAQRVTQGWGETKLGMTDEGAPLIVGQKRYDFGIGTHANGRIEFELPAGVSRFEALVGIPDVYQGRDTSVVFAIELDGKRVWESGTLRASDEPSSINLDVAGKRRLTLVTSDSGNGITDDHAVWLEPRIQ